MRFNVRQLCLDAMLAALCAVLGYLNLDFLNVSLNLSSLPILVGALLFGPVDGAAVAAVGTLASQLLRYGVSVTTPLWILPYVACGLAAGYCSLRCRLRPDRRQVLGIVALCEVLVTALNTPAIYVDSLIFGYYYPGIVAGALLLRLALCAVKSAIFAALLPGLLKALARAVRPREEEGRP